MSGLGNLEMSSYAYWISIGLRNPKPLLIPMSARDILRFKVLTDLRKHRLSQVDAAKILNITLRPVRRLLD